MSEICYQTNLYKSAPVNFLMELMLAKFSFTLFREGTSSCSASLIAILELLTVSILGITKTYKSHTPRKRSISLSFSFMLAFYTFVSSCHYMIIYYPFCLYSSLVGRYVAEWFFLVCALNM